MTYATLVSNPLDVALAWLENLVWRVTHGLKIVLGAVLSEGALMVKIDSRKLMEQAIKVVRRFIATLAQRAA
ncbi:MAG: hypothetical protein V2A66_00905 [Pseudomonadota bacterium]